jgi:Tfp pilus assembly protein PilF
MERAVKELSTAATQDPATELSHYLLAKAYRQLGNTEEANRETILFQQLRARRKGQNNAVLKELLGKSGIEQLVEDEP